MRAELVLRALREKASPTKARELQRFFKTGPGDYAHGDIFLGITVPVIRGIAQTYRDLPRTEIQILIDSKFHEVRFCALVILTNQYKHAKSEKEERQYFDFYVRALNRGKINNWDLVDVTAPTIGSYLLTEKDSLKILRKMAASDDLWVRRTAILFTFASLRIGDFKPTLEISTVLLHDDHDLIHKAVGWALREVGKISPMQLRSYLRKHGHEMSRTTLRYAIEKFPKSERKKWLESTR